eukprot:COSAG02_NODE_1382_length_12967_cov_9.151694_10_plen_79_part_00
MSACAPLGIETLFGNHHPSFTEYSNRPQNHAVARTVGTAMSHTIIDALTDERMVAAAKAEFDRVHAPGSSSKIPDNAL